MSKLEKMSLGEILSQTSLCITADSLSNIWQLDAIPEINIFNPEGISVSDEFKTPNLAEELIRNSAKLKRFLFGHECEIDKVKFLIELIRNYKETLRREGTSPEDKKKFEKDLLACRNLLKGINRTFVYYNRESPEGRIESLEIINTIDEAKGKSKPIKQKNIDRLNDFEKEEDFSNVAESLITRDIENICCYSKEIGLEIRFMIEFNSLLDSLSGNYKELVKICQSVGFDEFVGRMEQAKFVEEMTKVIRTYIEEIDVDKLFLCSAIRYLEALERGKIDEEQIPETYRRLKVIQAHTKKNSKLVLHESKEKKVTYDTQDLEEDLKRFISTGRDVSYIPIKKCNQIKTLIMSGKAFLSDVTNQEFEALTFTLQQINEILEMSPENYIFFLRQNKTPHSKKVILDNIISANQCSAELFQLLCEKTDISAEEICDLFDREIISVGDMKNVRDDVGQIITEEQVFAKYREYKQKINSPQETENSRVQLERYALAYRNTELVGKTDKELEEKGEEFIATVGEEIEPIDLVPLYGLNIIPLKVAVDWGGEKIINQLLRNETLKPADARRLRDEGLLDEKVLERLFKNSVNMSYSYQVALVCTIFDRQTDKEQEIRERLAQYYNIETAVSNASGKRTETKKRKYKAASEELSEVKQKVKMRDPGAKYNLLSALDSDVKIEQGIIDGHIIFHYPNNGEGTVLIEKLHKITTNKESGLIEIRADNESATYVMSEEEFIEMRHQLIKEGKVDRTQLTQRWWVTRDPVHWIPHNGSSSWEMALKERFEINTENLRYSPEDLARIDELITISIESKKCEGR